MKLMYSEVEAVLADVHDIPADAKIQFTAKVRNLRRVGIRLPSGAAGRKANYQPRDLLKLAFALELLEVGIPPEPAATLVAADWPRFVDALFEARRDKYQGHRESRYLAAVPGALTSKLHRFETVTATELAERIGGLEGLANVSRLTIINVSRLLMRIEDAIPRAGIDRAAFDADLDRAIIQGGNGNGHG